MRALLEKLHLQEVNPGVCTGQGGWITDSKGKELISYTPTTGEAIARVVQATPETFEKVLAAAESTFRAWRETPATKRGQIVRDLGNALREVICPLLKGSNLATKKERFVRC